MTCDDCGTRMTPDRQTETLVCLSCARSRVWRNGIAQARSRLRERT